MKYVKIFSKRTKIEAGGMIMLIVLISLSSVFGNPDGNDPNITYIKNGNGNYWTVANATNLQESLNQGGVTYFPATTIYTNQTIKIPSYTSLIGTGLNSILKADIGLSPTSSLIKNADQTKGNVYLEIRNLVLDGSNYTHSIGNPYTNYGLYWKNVSYGIVDMVWVKDTGKDGIRLETCSYCSTTHINTNSTGHHAVMFCYGTNYSSMSDLIITDSFTESAIVEHANTLTKELNHHITITNVIAKNCSQYGIFVRDAYSVTVTGCISEESDDNGFYIGNCHDVMLSNCITNDNRDHAGFVVNTSGNEVILTNCIARHAGTRSDSRGFELRGKNIQVSNCAVYDTKTPFNITGTARNITISDCTIINYTKPSIVWGDNVRFCDNKFLNHAATTYVLNITQKATNILVNDNDFRYAPTSLKKINDLSGNAIIYDNIELSGSINKPPVFGTPTPTNGSAGNPLSLTWSIPINDPEGNTFSWTIQCSNGQTNSGIGAINGTKTLVMSGLAYSKTYIVWVNATDPAGSGQNTRRWYTFMTQGSGIERLDQNQSQYNLSYALYTTRWVGQSFIPTVTNLTRVGLYIRKVGNPTSDAVLSVRSLLTGDDLVSISQPASEIPSTYSWVYFDISDLTVTPGLYYLVLRTAGGTSSNCYYWGYGYHTPYTNGIRVYSITGGNSWINNPSYDNCFKTYGI